MKKHHAVLIALVSAYAVYSFAKETPAPKVQDYACDYVATTQKASGQSNSVTYKNPIPITRTGDTVAVQDSSYTYHASNDKVVQFKLNGVEEYLQIPIDDNYARLQITVIKQNSNMVYSCIVK